MTEPTVANYWLEVQQLQASAAAAAATESVLSPVMLCYGASPSAAPLLSSLLDSFPYNSVGASPLWEGLHNLLLQGFPSSCYCTV